MLFSVGYFYSLNYGSLEGGAFGESKTLVVSKVLKYGKLEGVALGESLGS